MFAKTRVYTFPRGGIHYEDPSAPPRNACVTAFLPVISIIPLVHHTGSRAYPVVSVGDTVREGMLVGLGRGRGSANIHAAVPGKVIASISWKMLEGQVNEALVVRLEGSFDRLGRREEIFPWQGLNAKKLQEMIAEQGVALMESSGLPASELLASFHVLKGRKTLVVRCVFDDPWLAADYVLCRERLKAVVEGSVIAARASQSERILYAVSRRERDLGDGFLAEASAYDIPASVALVGSRYPQRNRRELELALQNYAVAEGFDLGNTLFLGPATLAAIYDAIKLRRPILDRYVAVGGSAVRNPQVMKVRIGARIGDLFEECGGFVGPPKRVAFGSPILGRLAQNLDEPIVKTSYAVFALLQGQTGGDGYRNCISCGECRVVCPVALDPEELYKTAGISGGSGTPGSVLAAQCHGCGCCDLVCPSRLPLSAVITNFARENGRREEKFQPQGAETFVKAPGEDF
jgi:electron transport complex protein RnfC